MRRIAVTGGAGQIAYSLLFKIANGDLFGPNEEVALHILDVPHSTDALKGVVMELYDSSFPLLKEIKMGADPRDVFAGVNLAILVGAKPRGPGMERADLLRENGPIFTEQGKALNDVAADDVVVFVVGNPCNTNCLIAMHHAPNIPRHRFHAMTRLDQNRASAQLALKAGVPVSQVEQMVIWGNHSSTQVPDFVNAKIGGKPVIEVIEDIEWLKGDFSKLVQNRGGEIIKARGKSSAASAAHSVITGCRSIYGIDKGIFSSAVCSTGNPYGISDDLVFSFPCRDMGGPEIEIVPDFEWDFFLEEKIKLSEQELIKERDQVKDLL